MNKITLFETEDDVQEKIPKIFNKTKEELEKDVKMLQEWMKTQPHLPEIIMGFAQLRQILVNNKCCVEVTKKKINKCYATKLKIPQIFGNFNPFSVPQLKKLLDNNSMVIAPLPKLTADMHRIVIVTVNDSEYLHKQLFDHFRCLTLSLTEIFLTESYHWKYIIIVDLSKCTLENVKNYLKISPLQLYKLLKLNEHTVTLRFEAIYVIVNIPSLINSLFEIAKKLIKPKLVKITHFCDEELIRKKFRKEILPEDYGGEEKSTKKLHDLLTLKFLEYHDRFDQLDQMTVDENSRPEELENDDFLGYYGDFKRLEVD